MCTFVGDEERVYSNVVHVRDMTIRHGVETLMISSFMLHPGGHVHK